MRKQAPMSSRPSAARAGTHAITDVSDTGKMDPGSRPAASPGMTVAFGPLCKARHRKRQGLRTRHERGDHQVFVRGMRLAADRTHRADGWRADRRGEPRTRAAAGELSPDLEAKVYGTTGVVLEQALGVRRLDQRLEFTGNRERSAGAGDVRGLGDL